MTAGESVYQFHPSRYTLITTKCITMKICPDRNDSCSINPTSSDDPSGQLYGWKLIILLSKTPGPTIGKVPMKFYYRYPYL